MGSVYLVRCEVNGKGYVGKTANGIDVRRYEHEYRAKKGSKLPFHRALCKYGFENFEWIVIFESEDESELNELEIISIKSMKTKAPNGYNLTDGGEGMVGLKRTDEHRAKLSKALKGRISANKGKKFSEDHRRKLSEAHKGKPTVWKGKKHSKESRKKMSVSAKGNQNHKGKRHSTQSKQKMSKALRGKSWTKKRRIACLKRQLRVLQQGI